MAVTVVLAIVSCKKDEPVIHYGADGKTPLPEAVDLGLSVRWASFNLGASHWYGYGSYFAWGETEAKDDYTQETYEYFENSSPLPEERDAAHVKLGGGWRMPTKGEISSLVNTQSNPDYLWEYIIARNAKKKVLYDADGRVIMGLRITYIPNGNSIFLPSAGQRQGKKTYQGANGFGAYWSTSLNDPSAGIHMHFHQEDNGSISASAIYTSARCHGLPIRPVYFAE